MKRTNAWHRTVSACMIVAAPCIAADASAQMKADEWSYRATIYGWFPSLSGTTAFPTGSGGLSMNVDADTIIENLKMAFMGTFEVQNGKWGGFVDWVYADIGGDKSGTRDFSSAVKRWQRASAPT